MKHLVAAFFLAAIVSAPASAEKDKYVIGTIKGGMKEANSQSGSIIADLAKTLSGRLGLNVTMEWYPDYAALVDAIGKDKVDFLLLFNEYSMLMDAMKNYRFKPFVEYTLLGMKETRGCIYFKTPLNLKSVQDLKGRGFLTYATDFEYYLLRDMVGQKPEEFFATTKVSPLGVASIMELAAKPGVDAIFVYEQNINWMRMTNPEPLKKMSQLKCSEPLHFVPLLHSEKVPAQLAGEVQKFFINAYKEEAAKRFLPLLRQFKIKFAPVTEKDYKAPLKLYNDALAKGWDKDFQKWVKGAQMIGVK